MHGSIAPIEQTWEQDTLKFAQQWQLVTISNTFIYSLQRTLSGKKFTVRALHCHICYSS